MDSYTLLVCNGLVSFIMTLTMVATFLTTPDERCLVDWSFAGLCFTLSNFMGIVFIYLIETPTIFFPSIGNVLFVAAFGFIYSGIRRHVKHRSAILSVAAVVLSVLFISWIPSINQSYDYRVLLTFPIVIGFNVLSIFTLYKAKNTELKKAYWPLISVLSIFSLLILIRPLSTFINIDLLSLLGQDFMQTSGSLSVIGFIFLMTIGFVTLIQWEKEIALQQLSITDNLTGWLNRHALHKIAKAEFERARREHNELVFVCIDIDNFKNVNDSKGHLVGDKVIQKMCHKISELTRDYDNHFRIGGDEFVIIFGNTTVLEVQRIVNRITELVSSTEVNFKNEQVTITVSIGLAKMQHSDHDWLEIYDRADEALYKAKRNGRNQSVFVD
ncbi:GGDEF domain-containing protein [Glaciecola sp. 1036]|uniref:GGDEF domain-containing protein n=1 Tax=Alteromonadaceae TaxID=72275 RepID=UPI003D070D15